MHRPRRSPERRGFSCGVSVPCLAREGLRVQGHVPLARSRAAAPHSRSGRFPCGVSKGIARTAGSHSPPPSWTLARSQCRRAARTSAPTKSRAGRSQDAKSVSRVSPKHRARGRGSTACSLHQSAPASSGIIVALRLGGSRQAATGRRRFFQRRSFGPRAKENPRARRGLSSDRIGRVAGHVSRSGRRRGRAGCRPCPCPR